MKLEVHHGHDTSHWLSLAKSVSDLQMPKCAWLIVITITMLNKTNDEALCLVILNIAAFFFRFWQAVYVARGL